MKMLAYTANKYQQMPMTDVDDWNNFLGDNHNSVHNEKQ